LCVELQAFCFYILAGLKRSNVPAEVTMRYFIFGVLTGLIFLLGISLLYGCLGTTNFSEIAVLLPAIITNSSDNSLIAVSVILIFVGIFFKLGIVPFHLWMADVYEGSPLFLTAIFAILPKIPFVLLLLKFFFIFNSAIVFLNLYILFNFLGLISIVVGTFGALYEVKIKRLLAYAAITHMGYIVLCLSLDFWEGAVAITFYLIVYVLMTIYAFGLLIGLSYWTADGKLTYIGDLFKRGNTFASINLSVLFLSMAGVPPFAGFFPKWYMFQLLLQSDCYFLALFIVIMSVVSSVYYLRLFKILIFDSFELWGPSRQIGVFLVLLIGIGFLINVFFFLIQGNLIMFLFLIIGRFF
jgi:NADH-quinone oxidoreductase subunit N